MNENSKWSTHGEKLTFEKSCCKCSRLETTKGFKVVRSAAELSVKDVKLASLSLKKVAPFQLISNVRTKV